MRKYSEKVMEQEWIVYGGRFTIQYKNKKALREFQESFSLV